MWLFLLGVLVGAVGVLALLSAWLLVALTRIEGNE